MTVMSGPPPSGFGVITLDTAVVPGFSLCGKRSSSSVNRSRSIQSKFQVSHQQ